MSGALLPATLRQMSEAERAWAGAMIDGEGTIVPRKPLKHRPQPQISFGNTEVELVATFLRITGTGSIGYRAPRRTNFVEKSKSLWTWYLLRVNDVPDFLRQIAPYSLKAQRYV